METTLVMATYNGEKYIEEQLNSILNQSQLPDEVIIVDDKSTDHTVGLIENFIQSHGLAHWELRVNQENLGFKENFRYALSLATKEWVFLCDQDDIWECDKIKSMVEVIDGNEEIKLLACSFMLMDANGEQVDITLEKKRSNNNLLRMRVAAGALVEVPFNIVAKENYAQGCCMCIKREIIFDYLKRKEIEVEHDWVMALLASAEKGSYFYNRRLIRYRVHGENAIGVDSYIAEHSDEYKENRVVNRTDLLRQEKHRYEIIKSSKSALVAKGVTEEIEWLEKRIEWLEQKKIWELIFGKLLCWKRPEYKMKTFGGDLLNIRGE